MQKLTYINLRGEQLEMSSSPPYILHRLNGVEPTELQKTTTRGAMQQGETTRAILRNARIVDATLSIRQDARRDMYMARAEAASLLALSACFDGEEMGRLIYENDAGTWWTYAVPETVMSGGSRARDNLLDMQMAFHCDSPYWFSLDEDYITLQMGDGSFELPFSFPIRFGRRDFSQTARNAGAVDAPVRITIEGTGEMPTLYNHTTGARITVARVIARGEQLIIDTDPTHLTVKVADASGQEENAFGYLDASLAITAFGLRPGDNLIEYAPSVVSNESRVTLRWHKRYEGV